MEVYVEQTGDLTRVITVTLPSEDFAGRVKNNLRTMQKRHRQRGFRPGKVPMSIIKSQFGPSIEAEVIDELIRNTLPQALKDHPEIVHVAPPEVLGKGTKDFGLQYRFYAERLPILETVDFRDVEVEKSQVKATDAQIDEKIEEIRKKNAVNAPVERDVVEDADVVKVSYKVIREGSDEGQEGEELEIVVGSGNFLPQFEQGLVGAKIDEPKMIEISSGENEVMQIEATVLGIFVKELPEIDDALAADEGMGETLAEMREKIGADIEGENDKKAENEMFETLFDALLEKNTFELPPQFFERQLNEELSQRLRPLQQQGLDVQQLDLEGLRAGMRPSFEAALRRSFLLGAIADAEEVQVADAAIDEHIEKLINGDPRGRRYYQDARRREEVRQELRHEKARDLVVESAKITIVERDADYFNAPNNAPEVVEEEAAEVEAQDAAPEATEEVVAEAATTEDAATEEAPAAEDAQE